MIALLPWQSAMVDGLRRFEEEHARLVETATELGVEAPSRQELIGRAMRDPHRSLYDVTKAAREEIAR